MNCDEETERGVYTEYTGPVLQQKCSSRVISDQ